MPPAPGMIAEQDLGLTERRVVGGEPDVRAQRQLAAAAQGVAGDRGDDRLRDAGDGGEGRLEGTGAPTMSTYDMSAISLMSAPAAKTRSPP